MELTRKLHSPESSVTQKANRLTELIGRMYPPEATVTEKNGPLDDINLHDAKDSCQLRVNTNVRNDDGNYVTRRGSNHPTPPHTHSHLPSPSPSPYSRSTDLKAKITNFQKGTDIVHTNFTPSQHHATARKLNFIEWSLIPESPRIAAGNRLQ